MSLQVCGAPGCPEEAIMNLTLWGKIVMMVCMKHNPVDSAKAGELGAEPVREKALRVGLSVSRKFTTWETRAANSFHLRVRVLSSAGEIYVERSGNGVFLVDSGGTNWGEYF